MLLDHYIYNINPINNNIILFVTNVLKFLNEHRFVLFIHQHDSIIGNNESKLKTKNLIIFTELVNIVLSMLLDDLLKTFVHTMHVKSITFLY